MSKVDADRIAFLKTLYEAGEKLTEAKFSTFIDALAEAAQEHEHAATGGPGSGTGDASPVVNLQHGWAASRPANPNPGDIWIEVDTSCVYVCFIGDIWVKVIG